MPECPVCRTRYVKGRLNRCHVCGWQFDSSGFSMIGPVKIQHQLSNVALGRIQAWAHHMWTTIQQQKERIVQLQTQLRQLQNQAAEQKALPASTNTIAPPPQLPTSAIEAPQSTTANASPEMWQWVLTRLEHAEQERAQLKAQIAQLQAQPTQPPALQGTDVKPEMQTELIKWREESRALQYQQSEQWQTIFEHFRYNTQQALTQHEQKLDTTLEPLSTQLTSQEQAIEQLEHQLQDLQHHADGAMQGAIAPLTDQLQNLQTTQGEISQQFKHQLESFQQAQADWATQQEQTFQQTQQVLNAQEQQWQGAIAPLQNQVETQAQAIADLETRLHAAQSQAVEQLTAQIQDIQNQSEAGLQSTVAPLAAQLQSLQTAQDDYRRQLESFQQTQSDWATEQEQKLQHTQTDWATQQAQKLQQTLAEQAQQLQDTLDPLQSQITAQRQAIEQLTTQIQGVQAHSETMVQGIIEPLRSQIEVQQQALAALETRLQASQNQTNEQLQAQLKAVQTQSEARVQGVIAPLAEQIQSLKTDQGDRFGQLEQQLESLQQMQVDWTTQQAQKLPAAIAALNSQLEAQKQAIETLETQLQDSQAQAIVPLAAQLQSLEHSQDQSVHQLADQIAQLQQTQEQAAQLISPTEIHATLERLEAQLQDLHAVQEQTLNLPQEVESLELMIQQHVQATEPASLAWQRQKNEILAKIDRFDTICEQFQTLESTVAQLQKAINTLISPSTVSTRRTNTVYTRYQ